MQISCTVSAQLISAFVFAIRIVQSIYNLIPKFQASSHLLWLYSLVCVGPGRKPRRPHVRLFNHGTNLIIFHLLIIRKNNDLFSFDYRCPLEVGLHKNVSITITEVEEDHERTDFWRTMNVHLRDRSLYCSLLNSKF